MHFPVPFIHSPLGQERACPFDSNQHPPQGFAVHIPLLLKSSLPWSLDASGPTSVSSSPTWRPSCPTCYPSCFPCLSYLRPSSSPCPFIIPPIPLRISPIRPCMSFIFPIIMPSPCIPSLFIGMPSFIGMSFFSWAIRGTRLRLHT